MYTSVNGEDKIFLKSVVVDPQGSHWFVEEFTHSFDERPKAKCRNGCCFVTWYVDQLEGVM